MPALDDLSAILRTTVLTSSHVVVAHPLDLPVVQRMAAGLGVRVRAMSSLEPGTVYVLDAGGEPLYQTREGRLSTVAPTPGAWPIGLRMASAEALRANPRWDDAVEAVRYAMGAFVAGEPAPRPPPARSLWELLERDDEE